MAVGNERGPSWLKNLQALNAGIQQAGPAATVGYTLIGAILLCGAVGYGIDRWFGTEPNGLVFGLLFGVAAGLYSLAKALWHR